MGLVQDKVAVVTGAARGQGRSHALGLAREGAHIIAIDICDSAPVEAMAGSYELAKREELEETSRLVEDLDRRCVTYVADVRGYPALDQAVRAGVDEFGRLDIVVANAGIWAVHLEEPTDPAQRIQVWNDTLAINLTGVWHTIETTVPHVLQAGNGGSIVITSSTQGLKGAANNDISLTSYTAAKHGLVGLMRASAIDLAPHSIRVNTIHPTGVLTPMVDNEVFAAYAEKHPRLGEIMQNLLPVQVVEVNDITNAVLYLASDLGRYVTGVTLPVDAGYLTG
jgi:SDR family mycofactocin-dependent oxidoreductase